MENIPQNLAFEMARQELVGCINYIHSTLGIPSYQIEILVRDVYTEVSAKARTEFEESKKKYEESLKETVKSEN
jgi:hypothetical protein